MTARSFNPNAALLEEAQIDLGLQTRPVAVWLTSIGREAIVTASRAHGRALAGPCLDLP